MSFFNVLFYHMTYQTQHTMKKQLTLITLLIFCLLAPVFSFANEPQSDGLVVEQQKESDDSSTTSGTSSARVDLTTDYIWRGVSQTNDHLALQGEWVYSNQHGVSFSLFGSNVDLSESLGRNKTLELRPTIAYGKQWEEIGMKLGACRYVYVENDGVSFNEYFAVVTRDVFYLSAAFTDSFYGSHDRGVYVSAGFDALLPKHRFYGIAGISIGGHLGHYEFDGDMYGQSDYTDYALYVEKAWKILGVRVGWTSTDSGFNAGKRDNSRFLATLSLHV